MNAEDGPGACDVSQRVLDIAAPSFAKDGGQVRPQYAVEQGH